MTPHFITRLEQKLGKGAVLVGDDIAERSCDPFVHLPPSSPALLRPRSTEEVSWILEQCHAIDQPIVLHGGRTGVAGGAVATDQEIVVSLERLNRILEIDPISMTMTVEAGVAIEAIQEAALKQDLFYPIDLGSKGTATIGGTIATNAGGNRVIRWGMTRQNVLGLEVVLTDGSVLNLMNRFLKNNTGYDLKQLFIGSEGTLGVVSKAILRLVPKPTTQKVALVAVEHYDNVLKLLTRARAMQQLSAFEVMWRDYYDIVSIDPARRFFEPGASFYILIEAMGNSEECDEKAFTQFLEKAFEDGLVADAVVAHSGKQNEDIWRVREGSEILVREMGSFVSFDISVEISRADAFVLAVRQELKTRFGNFRSVAFGHLGDSNIHIGVNIGDDTLSRVLEIEQCVYAVLHEFGGALTAEHGIGTTKKNFLPMHIPANALNTMRKIRQALDSKRLANRNVLFDP